MRSCGFGNFAWRFVAYGFVGFCGLPELWKGLREVFREAGFLLREVPERDDE